MFAIRLWVMLIGYARVSKAEGSQVLDLHRDASIAAGVEAAHIFEHRCSGSKDDRPSLAACLKSLRKGDVLVIWKLDRLGRNLKHLISFVEDLTKRGVGFKVLQGNQIDTTTATGKLNFGLFALLAEFERDIIRERTIAGLAAARAKGRKGGRKPAFTPSKLHRPQLPWPTDRDTSVSVLCEELSVSTAALYRYVTPTGSLTDRGEALLRK